MPVNSRFQTVNLPTNGGVGGDDGVFSPDLSLNLYLESQQGSLSGTRMRTFPGQEVMATNSNYLAVMCIFTDGVRVFGIAYKETTPGLYSLYVVNAISGTDVVFLGGSDVMSPNIYEPVKATYFNGSFLISVDNKYYVFDPVAETSTGNAPDSNSRPEAYVLNDRIYKSGGETVYVSDVLSYNFDLGNVFQNRSSSTGMRAFIVFNQMIYLFGVDTIEPWQPIDSGSPPVARINQGIIEGVGCRYHNAVAATDKYIYFFGSDGAIYRINGFNAESITPPGISQKIEEINPTDARVESIYINGYSFVLFRFIDLNDKANTKTLMFCENTGLYSWLGDDNYKYLPQSFLYYQNTNAEYRNRIWCSEYGSNRILTLSSKEVNPNPKERIIVTVSGDDIGEPGVLLEMSKLRLSIETGNSNPSSPSANAQILIYPSFDGGYTYKSPIIKTLGIQGDYTKPIEVSIMKQFRRATFKIRVSDNVESFTIFSASIDIRKAGR